MGRRTGLLFSRPIATRRQIVEDGAEEAFDVAPARGVVNIVGRQLQVEVRVGDTEGQGLGASVTLGHRGDRSRCDVDLDEAAPINDIDRRHRLFGLVRDQDQLAFR